jgi:hypothetical protein
MGENTKGAIEISGFGGSATPSISVDSVVAFSTIPGLNDHVLVYPNSKGDWSLAEEFNTLDAKHDLAACKRVMGQAGYVLQEMVDSRTGRLYWVKEEAVAHMPATFLLRLSNSL